MNNKNTIPVFYGESDNPIVIKNGINVEFVEINNVSKFKEKTTNEDLKDDFPYYLGFAVIGMGV